MYTLFNWLKCLIYIAFYVVKLSQKIIKLIYDKKSILKYMLMTIR